MCMLSAFCSNATQSSCYNTTFARCEECSFAGLFAFGFIVALLGLTIVATNLLVVLQVVWKKNKRTYDKIKASMAVADMLAGLQPLVISLYYLHWTIHLTPNELSQTQLTLRGSLQAIAGGIFYKFGFSSSLYHLVFLSQQRVFAMRWPLKYRVQKARTVDIGLGIVWILAILSAVAPACFPDEITFMYESSTFLFGFVAENILTMIIMIAIAWLFPFLVMTCFMIYSTILIRRNVRRSKRLSGNNSNQEVHNKRESSMLKTVALMQVGFTLTLAPLGIYTMLKYLPFPLFSSCRSLAIPRLVCYYLSMTNSLVNPIIYSIRDKEYRKYIRQCFQKRLHLVNVLDRTKPIEQTAAKTSNEHL